MKKFRSVSRPAYSLIFVFMVVTAFLMITAASLKNTTDKLSLYIDMEGDAQAHLTAESVVDLAVLAIADTDGDGVKDYSPGYEASEAELLCLDKDGDGNCDSWGNFTVLAEQKASEDGFYYTPIFGTGSAGNTEDCSVPDYIDLSTGERKVGLEIELDDPCHWNKLLYGGSVSIPLFDTDDDTGSLQTPAELSGFSGWNLKVRTPCDSSLTSESTCDSTERYELDDGELGTGSVYEQDSSVLFWQLIGIDAEGNSYSLLPNDETEGSTRDGYSRDPLKGNTEIYESLINEARDYSALDVNSSSAYSSLYDFCMGDFEELYLQMNIVTTLLDVNGASIPYLEWQLEVDSLEPLADRKSVLIGEAYFEGLQNAFYSTVLSVRETVGESANIYTLSN